MQQPENMLIIHCVRTNISPEQWETIAELLTQPIDWQYLIKQLERNFITSLFAYNVRRLPQVSANTDLSAYFEKGILKTTLHNLRLKSELYRVMKQFQEHEIRAIPFKGPILAEIIYKSIALRHILDLDILINIQQYPAVCNILLSLGYHIIIDVSQHPDDDVQGTYHTKFIHVENGVKLELHWHLAENWRAVLESPEGFWEFVVPFKLDGLEIEVFRKEFLFTYLCVHGYRHYWQRLKWLIDIAELIDCHPDIDWEMVDTLALRYGLVDIVDMGFLLARDILDAKIPANAANRIASKPKLLTLKTHILQMLFPEATALASGEFPISNRLYLEYILADDKHKRQLLTHQFTKIFFRKGRWTPNQADWDWIHLPTQLSFLYYGIRPFRLIYKYGLDQVRFVWLLLQRQ